MRGFTGLHLVWWCLSLAMGWFLAGPIGEPLQVARGDLSEPSTVWSPVRQESAQRGVVLADLAQANVVYLGEIHDQQADHQAQQEVIRALHGKNPQMAIALEMFQRPFQPWLDRYLAGEITEDELREKSEYDKRWGWPWEYYAPVLRFARDHQVSLLAVNAPSEVTRQVSQDGLDTIDPALRQWMPPVEDIRTDNSAYRERLRTLYLESHQNHGTSDGFERFFLAQVVWDETMAEAIATFLEAYPDHQVIVLAGQGHIAYGDGIPSRVARRLEGTLSPFVQRTVLMSGEGDRLDSANNEATHSATSPTLPPIADYIWMLQN